MPRIDKKCLLCGAWIKKSQRKYHCLCGRCINKLTEEWIARRKKRDAHL